jgi:hypothetical protein
MLALAASNGCATNAATLDAPKISHAGQPLDNRLHIRRIQSHFQKSSGAADPTLAEVS